MCSPQAWKRHLFYRHRAKVGKNKTTTSSFQLLTEDAHTKRRKKLYRQKKPKQTKKQYNDRWKWTGGVFVLKVPLLSINIQFKFDNLQSNLTGSEIFSAPWVILPDRTAFMRLSPTATTWTTSPSTTSQPPAAHSHSLLTSTQSDS